MSNINFFEKSNFEGLFGMSTGYVLDFNDRTFQDFISEAIGIDIYADKYHYRSGSKANCLRGFWNLESNYIVGKLLDSLLKYWLFRVQSGKINHNESDDILFKECLTIVEKLKREVPVDNIDALQSNNDDRDFSLLSKSIKESIENNEPGAALDRLHTFVVKYVRELCTKHSLTYKKDTPLHNLFGSYVKYLIEQKIIDSKMTELILKSSISVLESFNDIRNNKSLAHDNPILNYNESIMIFNGVSNVIKFIESIEKPVQEKDSSTQEKDVIELGETDDLPF
jgi:hypothetical protein